MRTAPRRCGTVRGDQFIAKLLLAAIALFVGVGGIWLLFTGVSSVVERFPPTIRDRVLPWVFVAPGAAAARRLPCLPGRGDHHQQLPGQERRVHPRELGKPRHRAVPRDPSQQRDLVGRWRRAAASASACSIAALFDRIRRESLAKVFVFTPLAISLVGATVIWGFVYAWQPPGQPQFGLLNAIWTAFGNQPVPWATTFPINLPAEIMIMIWLQTGFAMVVLSAAIKGVSTEVLEAARLDGANERQIFFGVIVPIIRGSIITVATTIAIATLKIFDIVYSMSGGRNHDDVVAVRMFTEMFQFFNDGRAAALATVLFIAVLPVMIINLRNFRRQQAM